MGKDIAASVPWSQLSAAISANPQRSTPLFVAGSASASVAAMPVDATLAWCPGWTEDTTQTIGDIVSCVLWVRDPMYRTAAAGVRRAMEREEAAALLHGSEEGWARHGGRQRGWVRKHLEEDLRARAGGADPAPDAWETARNLRRAAHLVEYVCVMRDLRVALWWPEHHSVSVIGVGDKIVNLNATSGRMMLAAAGSYTMPSAAWPALLRAAKDITWAPAACAPSVGTNTVAQIQAAIAEISGSGTKTGARATLWSHLQWLRLERSLNGVEANLES